MLKSFHLLIINGCRNNLQRQQFNTSQYVYYRNRSYDGKNTASGVLPEDPKTLVADLIKPMVKSGDTVESILRCTPKFNGVFWKAELQLHWPRVVHFTGIHESLHKAEELAYLKACDLYKQLGLLFVIDGKFEIATEDKVFHVLQTMYERGTYAGLDTQEHSKFEIATTKINENQYPVWSSELKVPWPYSFSISTIGLTMHSTQYMTCLLTCMRLKMLGLLDKNNNLNINRIPTAGKHTINNGSKRFTRKDFAPQYEIFVDASKSGMGAYLLTRDEDGKIHWISDPWSNHFPTADFTQERWSDTAFTEYYALVTAVYTWKLKFINKKVLCWSDNMAAVNFTNNGPNAKETNLQKYGKLYRIMIQTCAKYNICLKALHVRRVNNSAADMLSKLQISKFQKLVPGAKKKSKKSKKLMFWKPISENDKPKNKPKPDPESNNE